MLRRTLVDKLEQESPMIGPYLVPQEPSLWEARRGCVTRLKKYTPADGEPLDFLTFGKCMEKRERIPNKVIRGHGESAHDARC
jgi:hypothetical protein